MEGHISKGVDRRLFRQKVKQNRFSIKWLILILVICLILFGIQFVDLNSVGNVILESQDDEIFQISDITSYDVWLLGNSTGTLQVDYVNVEQPEKFNNETFFCLNGSTSKDVSSLLYIWYINGSLSTSLNTSTIISAFGVNFTTHDRIECGIIPQNGSSLIAYWPFDEGSGIAFKEIINNKSGTITTADWKPGRNYYSINISQANDYRVSSPKGLNLTKNFTYEIWMYPTVDTNYVILENANTVSIEVTSGKIRGLMKISEATSSLKIISVDSISQNRWNQIVFTYDNINASLYLNGELQNKTNVTGNVDDYTGDILFGESSTIASLFLRGQIDEVAIYNRSLTADEVRNHYNRGIAIFSKKNTAIIDRTEANFLNGTLTNLTYSTLINKLILSNCSTNVYCKNGEYISTTKSILDNDNPIKISYGLSSTNSANVTFEARTGIRGENGSTIWSDYFTDDPAYNNDSKRIIALSFSEGKGNVTKELISGGDYYLGNLDFTPKGKIGYAMRFLGDGKLTIDDFSQLRLNNLSNYTFEFFIKPEISSEMGLFTKNKYLAFLNGSLNIVYNATCGDVNYSIVSNRSLIEDEWNYVVITYDSKNNSQIFINGNLSATETFNGTIDTGTQNFVIGALNELDKFNGSIDSFVIYNKTLSSNEINNKVYNMNNSGVTIDSEDFVQYKITFRSDGTATPSISNVSILLENHSVFVYNSLPYGMRVGTPTNNTNISNSNNITFNWTTATDLEGDSIFYEFLLANFSNMSNILFYRMGINNYSLQNYSDMQTLLVEHFDYKEDLINHGWKGNWSATGANGRFKGGFEITHSGKYLRNSRDMINSEQGTIEFWTRPYWNPSDGGTSYFFEHTNERISMNRTGSKLSVSINTNPANVITYNISNWNAMEWHHLAVSWKENSNLTLIVDGIQANTTNISQVSSFSGRFYLGSNAVSDSSNIVFNGTIDELRISNVQRNAYSTLTSNEMNNSFGNVSDGDYYWTVKAIQIINASLDAELVVSNTDTRRVRVSRSNPTITFVEDFVKIYSEVNTTINITSSENVLCQYRTLNGNSVNMSRTGEIFHSQTINLTNFGNFTYYFVCNDSNNNLVNKSYSFYVFYAGISPVVSIPRINFSARDNEIISRSIGSLDITTKDSITSNAGIIKHRRDSNPENSSYGLEAQKVAFWTILLDDNLVANLTGNVTVNFIYESEDITDLSALNFSLYWFNPRTSIWEDQGINVQKESYLVQINTSRFGTYALSGIERVIVRNPPPIIEDGLAKRGLLKPTTKRFGTKGSLGEIIPEEVVEEIIESEEEIEDYLTSEEDETDNEDGTTGEEDETDEQDVIQDVLMKSAEWIQGEKWLMMILYLFGSGIIVFYGYRMALALLFKYQKKESINLEDLEKEVDDKVKYFVYTNINKENLNNELVKKGWETEKIEKIISKVKKLGRGKFEEYIYKHLAEGKNEGEIVRNLVEKGWNENQIKEEIEKFKRI